MKPLATLDEVIAIIREYHGFSEHDRITPEMLLEEDLRISGDDGADLLKMLEDKFAIRFADAETSFRETFDLAPDQQLFYREGCNPFLLLFNLFGFCRQNVKPISVAELHRVINVRQKQGGRLEKP